MMKFCLICLFHAVFFFNLFLFLAALGLRCCTRAFSGCGERGLLFFAVHGLLHRSGFSCCRARALGAWASVVVAHRLSRCGSQALERRLSSCGARTQLLRGMWDLPGPGLEPVSPALAGGFLTTAPPGKSHITFLLLKKVIRLCILFLGLWHTFLVLCFGKGQRENMASLADWVSGKLPLIGCQAFSSLT